MKTPKPIRREIARAAVAWSRSVASTPGAMSAAEAATRGRAEWRVHAQAQDALRAIVRESTSPSLLYGARCDAVRSVGICVVSVVPDRQRGRDG